MTRLARRRLIAYLTIMVVVCSISIGLTHLTLPMQVQASDTTTTTTTAKPTCDELELRVLGEILAKYRSPLPNQTIACFHYTNPDFDVAGYLAVVYAESSLGRYCGVAKNNPGCIKGGKVGSVWRDLRVGTTKSGFNLYRNMYDGQRAAIRLLYDSKRGYNAKLAAGDFWGFARIYYGKHVPASYVNTLVKAHDKFVALAAEKGVGW